MDRMKQHVYLGGRGQPGANAMPMGRPLQLRAPEFEGPVGTLGKELEGLQAARGRFQHPA